MGHTDRGLRRARPPAPGGRVLAQTVTVPGVPTGIAGTSAADSLTVSWAAPDDDGGAAVSAYDLRYIETDDDETDDDNWTVVEDAWTSGALSYSIAGLRDSTSYDVQLRAVNSAGDGAWSASTTRGHGRLRQHSLDGRQLRAERLDCRRGGTDRYGRRCGLLQLRTDRDEGAAALQQRAPRYARRAAGERRHVRGVEQRRQIPGESVELPGPRPPGPRNLLHRGHGRRRRHGRVRTPRDVRARRRGEQSPLGRRRAPRHGDSGAGSGGPAIPAATMRTTTGWTSTRRPTSTSWPSATRSSPASCSTAAATTFRRATGSTLPVSCSSITCSEVSITPWVSCCGARSPPARTTSRSSAIGRSSRGRTG